jgi:hypothetical protein
MTKRSTLPATALRDAHVLLPSGNKGQTCVQNEAWCRTDSTCGTWASDAIVLSVQESALTTFVMLFGLVATGICRDQEQY